MEKHKSVFRIWYIIASMFFIILILTVSTYAWFSANRVVSTDKVTSRTGTEELKLEISSKGGSDFNGSDVAPIIQVNQTSLTRLMPVSTADLKSFVYNPISTNGKAKIFEPVENEEFYYHGRFYLRAFAEGGLADAKVNLYFDEGNEIGGTLAQAEKGLFLNAARLGLTFDKKNPVIFSLSNKHNKATQQANHTILNHKELGDQKVLSLSNGELKGVTDPSIPLSDRTIVMGDSGITFPKAPLLEMEMGKIYTVDVYVYLEGCDLDCSDSISYDEADLYLEFYGILKE